MLSFVISEIAVTVSSENVEFFIIACINMHLNGTLYTFSSFNAYISPY